MHIGAVFPQVEIGSGENPPLCTGAMVTCSPSRSATWRCPRQGTLPPPWRYEDHYGFGAQSSVE